MRIIKFSFFFFFITIFNLYAGADIKSDPDSSRYKWIKGKKYILHQVKNKETWSSIAKRYVVSSNDVMNANIGVSDLKPGQIINIPVMPAATATTAAKTNQDPETEPKNKTAILYTVLENETLYSISKKFHVSVEQIMAWNRLQSDAVAKGQKIVVKYINGNEKPEAKKVAGNNLDQPVSPDKILNEKNIAKDSDGNSIVTTEKRPAIAQPVETTAISKPLNTNVRASSPDPDTAIVSRSLVKIGSKNSNGKSLMQVTESGICTWLNDGNVSQSKFYALHRTAPTGTIIRVTNKMNLKYVFVKVVGLLPDTGDNDKSIIKISQTAVNKLGALDAHFHVELSYGVMQ